MAVQAPGPYELRDVFDDEDVAIVATLDGTGTIAAYNFRFKVWNEAGTLLVNATTAPACEITDAAARQVTGRILGLTLAAGVYRWSIRRTDAGSRTLCAWGSFTLRDETGEPLRDA